MHWHDNAYIVAHANRLEDRWALNSLEFQSELWCRNCLQGVNHIADIEQDLPTFTSDHTFAYSLILSDFSRGRCDRQFPGSMFIPWFQVQLHHIGCGSCNVGCQFNRLRDVLAIEYGTCLKLLWNCECL